MGDVTIDLDSTEDWGDVDDKAKQNQVREKFEELEQGREKYKEYHAEKRGTDEKSIFSRAWGFVVEHKYEILAISLIILGAALMCVGGFILITAVTGVADISCWAVAGVTAVEATRTVGMAAVGLGYTATYLGLEEFNQQPPIPPSDFPWPYP